MSSADDVAILLSTRNGAAYLGQQLDSLVAQSHQAWRIFWRDDGSQDGTTALMHDFAAGAGAGRVVDLNDNAGHLGIMASFLGLLRRAPRGHIVAFADQDDVWLPDKLARGVAALHRMADGPGLYCARQQLVTADLTPIRLSAPVRGRIGFPHSMTQNIATGCTVMLNPAAAGLLADAQAPASETLHDWWAYVLVSACGGQVVADEAATVLYRQHAHNAVGVPLSPARRGWAALRRGPNVFMRTFRAHMDALNDQPDIVSAEARSALRVITDGLHDGWNLRLKALRHPGLQRQNWAETQLFRLWFMLG